MTFEYDNRGRLISETRTVGQEDVYDISYTYDQLGNRQTKIDSVNGQWVVYDYDVDLADPNELEFPTWHNRLLEYRMYDGDPNDPNTSLLRTVSYTYYKTGQASNITVKDEGEGSEYDTYHDLALYYHSHGPLWRALWGSYELDEEQEPTGYETSWAREFVYDSPRQRFLAVDYDTVVQGEGSSDPKEWTWDVGLWTEYAGVLPYTDLETDRDVADPNHPAQYEYERTEVLRYLGTAAQQTADTNETAFQHGDLIGSTNLTTDDDGDALQTPAVAYTAFGEVIGDASTLATRYQYAGAWGYESDLLALSGVNPNLPDITLQHVGHRWYQPDLGRFIQRDPIGIAGGLNVYVYVGADPLANVDPDGRGLFGAIGRALKRAWRWVTRADEKEARRAGEIFIEEGQTIPKKEIVYDTQTGRKYRRDTYQGKYWYLNCIAPDVIIPPWLWGLGEPPGGWGPSLPGTGGTGGSVWE